MITLYKLICAQNIICDTKRNYVMSGLNKKVEKSIDLQKLAEYDFLKKALNDLFLNKLYTDGYVYCDDKILMSKEKLSQCISQESPFYCLVSSKSTNASDFKELASKFDEIKLDNSSTSFYEDCAIVYSLFKAKGELGKSTLLMMWLNAIKIFNPCYVQHGDFIYDKEKIKLIKISSLKRYIEEIEKLLSSDMIFYRGHTNINYKVLPSLFRNRKWIENESDMYHEILLRCSDSFSKCRTNIDILAEMQHYGLPTRMMDITSNPLIALFFACNKTDNVGEVIVFNVPESEMYYQDSLEVDALSSIPKLKYKKQKELLNALNEKKQSKLVIGKFKDVIPHISNKHIQIALNSNLYVKPVRRNNRILHQEGAFLLWGLNEAVYKDKDVTDNLNCKINYRYNMLNKYNIYYVETGDKKKIIESLDKIGVNSAYVYPEIDDVAHYIKETYEK